MYCDVYNIVYESQPNYVTIENSTAQNRCSVLKKHIVLNKTSRSLNFGVGRSHEINNVFIDPTMFSKPVTLSDS